MRSNEVRPSRLASWAGPVALLAVAAGAAGLGLWQMNGGYGLIALAAGLFALGGVWLYHVYATRRQLAVWNAYAEKELARTEHLPHTASVNRKQELSRSNV